MPSHYESRRDRAARKTQNIRNMFTNNDTEAVQALIDDASMGGMGDDMNADGYADTADADNDNDDDDANNGGDDGGGDDGSGGTNGVENDGGEEPQGGLGSDVWSDFNRQFLNQVKEKIDQSMQLVGRGNNAFYRGSFPQKYRNIVSPSSDPLGFWPQEAHPLSMEHFSVPDFLVWIPEMLFPKYYQNNRPKCKWHNTTDCINLKGYVTTPRHCYGAKRTLALIGKWYLCKIRQQDGSRPHYFRSYDANVIANCHECVKIQWQKHGFYLSKRAGISVSLLEALRSGLNQGLGVSGFRNILLERCKKNYFLIRRQHQAHVNDIKSHCYFITPEQIEERKVEFFEFDSKDFDQTVPSCCYLIARVISLMESDAKYKTLRMQMIDGKHLSGDHSFKLVKCVTLNGTKAYTAMYCIMNEFGQVVGWWFTTGTGMKEIQAQVKKVKERYFQLGFDGPETVSTDRCCNERSFWTRLLGLRESKEQIPNVDDSLYEEMEILDLPHEPKLATTTQATDILVGEISLFLNSLPREQKVIGVDCEWELGRAKADLLIVSLMDDRVYLFHLALIGPRRTTLPMSLKTLLEATEQKTEIV